MPVREHGGARQSGTVGDLGRQRAGDELVLAERAGAGDVALLLDSDLVVEGEDCSVSFLLVPDQGGVDQMLKRLGV